MSIEHFKSILDRFPEASFTRFEAGLGGHKYVYVLVSPTMSLEDRASYLLSLEDALMSKDDSVRVWHEPLGDKNSLRQLRGVSISK